MTRRKITTICKGIMRPRAAFLHLSLLLLNASGGAGIQVFRPTDRRKDVQHFSRTNFGKKT
jgi:hypothetical protein